MNAFRHTEAKVKFLPVRLSKKTLAVEKEIDRKLHEHEKKKTITIHMEEQKEMLEEAIFAVVQWGELTVLGKS